LLAFGALRMYNRTMTGASSCVGAQSFFPIPPDACADIANDTFLYDLATNTWTTLPAEVAGLPFDAGLIVPPGMGRPNPLGLALSLVYVPPRGTVVAVSGGYWFTDDRLPSIPTFEFDLAKGCWYRLQTGGTSPGTGEGTTNTRSAAHYLPWSDEIVSFSGTSWDLLGNGELCYMLSLSTLVWRVEPACGYNMGPWMRFDALTWLDPAAGMHMLGGRFTDGNGYMGVYVSSGGGFLLHPGGSGWSSVNWGDWATPALTNDLVAPRGGHDVGNRVSYVIAGLQAAPNRPDWPWTYECLLQTFWLTCAVGPGPGLYPSYYPDQVQYLSLHPHTVYTLPWPSLTQTPAPSAPALPLPASATLLAALLVTLAGEVWAMWAATAHTSTAAWRAHQRARQGATTGVDGEMRAPLMEPDAPDLTAMIAADLSRGVEPAAATVSAGSEASAVLSFLRRGTGTVASGSAHAAATGDPVSGGRGVYSPSTGSGRGDEGMHSRSAADLDDADVVPALSNSRLAEARGTHRDGSSRLARYGQADELATFTTTAPAAAVRVDATPAAHVVPLTMPFRVLPRAAWASGDHDVELVRPPLHDRGEDPRNVVIPSLALAASVTAPPISVVAGGVSTCTRMQALPWWWLLPRLACAAVAGAVLGAATQTGGWLAAWLACQLVGASAIAAGFAWAGARPVPSTAPPAPAHASVDPPAGTSQEPHFTSPPSSSRSSTSAAVARDYSNTVGLWRFLNQRKHAVNTAAIVVLKCAFVATGVCAVVHVAASSISLMPPDALSAAMGAAASVEVTLPAACGLVCVAGDFAVMAHALCFWPLLEARLADVV